AFLRPRDSELGQAGGTLDQLAGAVVVETKLSPTTRTGNDTIHNSPCTNGDPERLDRSILNQSGLTRKHMPRLILFALANKGKRKLGGKSKGRRERKREVQGFTREVRSHRRDGPRLLRLTIRSGCSLPRPVLTDKIIYLVFSHSP